MTEPEHGTADVSALYARLKGEARRILMGQDQAFELLCVALLSGGHVLLEGVPGTAKTLMAKLLSRLVHADFRRIQFTPDLMPSDIVGTTLFDLQASAFRFRKGPVFTQILLADEINRAPAKTQAALLEAMEERQVTVDGTRYALDAPFMVIATQNPVEYEGTYPLPEAQLDRFLFKLAVPYPNSQAEEEVLAMYHRGFDAQKLEDAAITAVLEPQQLESAKAAIREVTVDTSMLGYIVALSQATRESEDVSLGASPRASIALLLASKTIAAMRGRDFVTPDDIKANAPSVLRHRVILRPEAEIEGLTADQFVSRVLDRVPVPR